MNRDTNPVLSVLLASAIGAVLAVAAILLIICEAC